MQPPESKPLPRLGLAAVVALAAIPFLFGLKGEFVYDDELLIAANPALQDLTRLPELLSTSLSDFMTVERDERVVYWRPLSALVLALTWAVGGGAPIAFKIVSLALHLAAVFAAAGFARRISGRNDVALAAALLFGAHPIGVEAVTWVSAVNDPLLMMCALFGASSWIDWRRGGSRGVPWRGAVWLALAMLSKEAAVALVLLPLVLDAALLRRERPDDPRGLGRAALVVVPWLAAYWLIRVAVFGSWDGGLLADDAYFAASKLRLLGLRVELLGGALALIAWPADLVAFRPFRPNLALTDAGLLVPLAALVAYAVALVWSWRRDRTIFVGLAWASVVLFVPALRIESLGQFPLSDRFVYAAVPGVALAFVLAARRTALATRPRIFWAMVLVVTVALSARGAERTQAWQDTRTFWETASVESPDVAHVWWNLGRLELRHFREVPTLPTAQRAREHFERAGDLANADREGRATAAVTSNDVLQLNLGLGWSLLYESEVDGYGDSSGAGLVFEQVLLMRPSSHEAWGGRGIARLRAGDLDGAIESLTRSLDLQPNYALAHFNMGVLRMSVNDWVKARNHFDRVVELDPSNVEALLWSAHAAVECHDPASGRKLAERALRAAPRDSGPSVLLGILDRRENRLASSLEHFDRALAIEPNDGKAHNERAKTLGLLGRHDEALTSFVEASRLGHDHFEPHYNVAALLIEAGSSNDAVLPYLQRAYELCPDPSLLGALRGSLDARLPAGDPVRATLALHDERRGSIEAALDWAESATEGDDSDGTGAYVYGRMLRFAERAEEAIVWLTIADERRPNDFLRLRELGSAYAATGAAERARAAYERAIAALPPPVDERQQVRAEQLRAEVRALIAHLDAEPTPTNGGER